MFSGAGSLTSSTSKPAALKNMISSTPPAASLGRCNSVVSSCKTPSSSSELLNREFSYSLITDNNNNNNTVIHVVFNYMESISSNQGK
jgi:hypothetical protein